MGESKDDAANLDDLNNQNAANIFIIQKMLSKNSNLVKDPVLYSKDIEI